VNVETPAVYRHRHADKGTFPQLRSSFQQTLLIRHIARVSRCCHLIFSDRPHPHVVMKLPGNRGEPVDVSVDQQEQL
jgi:hypothetical protein